MIFCNPMRQRLAPPSFFALKMVGFGAISFLLLLPAATFSRAPFVFGSDALYHVDKILLYVGVYYLPFMVAYGVMRIALGFTRLDANLGYPALAVYFLLSLMLYATNMWWARGMDVDSQGFYLLLLFGPWAILNILKFGNSVKNHKCRTRQSTPTPILV